MITAPSSNIFDRALRENIDLEILLSTPHRREFANQPLPPEARDIVQRLVIESYLDCSRFGIFIENFREQPWGKKS